VHDSVAAHDRVVLDHTVVHTKFIVDYIFYSVFGPVFLASDSEKKIVLL